jgi:hypothetical protein
VVFAACFLLWGLAVLDVVVAIGAFFAIGEFHRYHSMWQGDELAGQAAALALVLFAVGSLVSAAVVAALAVLTERGLRTARVVTWAVTGVTLVLSVAVAAADVYAAAPWYGRLIAIVTTAKAVLTVTAVVLLALPVSNVYFGGVRRVRAPAARPRLRPRPVAGPGGSAIGVLAVVAACLALVATGSVAPGATSNPRAPAAARHVEPPHNVTYLYAIPAAKPSDRFEITYLDAWGRPQSLIRPGDSPVWVEVIRLPRGATRLELNIRSSAASSAPMIYCYIQIDGYVVRTSDGNPCRVRLAFPLTPQEDTNNGR